MLACGSRDGSISQSATIGPDWNNNTNFGWIVIKCYIDIHGPQRIIPAEIEN